MPGAGVVPGVVAGGEVGAVGAGGNWPGGRPIERPRVVDELPNREDPEEIVFPRPFSDTYFP